ncbi:MAG: hypothetical protein K9M54_12165 [Kiritimatiellales bacterium]|nr:hypothetical protein [Kiritimatiellales bacterium]MCF7864394.1 hypothetical protein [Kiritimatiellales bacterium]
MDSKKQFDFWYAVNNTELVTTPTTRLETFGETIVNYHMVCELMDSVDKVCIREGQLKALKPEIITPQSLGQMDLEDFGQDAKNYADWLAKHGGDLRILQYGFRIQKQEIKEHIVTDQLANVLDRVKTEVKAKDDPLSAILIGVDDPWQVCLLKLMVDLVQHSAKGNIQDIRHQAAAMQHSLSESIERGFLEASRDPSKINALAERLKQNGLWEKYEDRFFSLVKASGYRG